MDTLFLDLVTAAGPFMESGLNQLPRSAKLAVEEALSAGGWLEVRVGFMNEAASAVLVITNLDGATTELCRLDHTPDNLSPSH